MIFTVTVLTQIAERPSSLSAKRTGVEPGKAKNRSLIVPPVWVRGKQMLKQRTKSKTLASSYNERRPVAQSALLVPAGNASRFALTQLKIVFSWLMQLLIVTLAN
jgi:hypothetical protein